MVKYPPMMNGVLLITLFLLIFDLPRVLMIIMIRHGKWRMAKRRREEMEERGQKWMHLWMKRVRMHYFGIMNNMGSCSKTNIRMGVGIIWVHRRWKTLRDTRLCIYLL